MKHQAISTKAQTLPPPMETIVPSQFQRILGLQNADIAQALMNNPSLEEMLNNTLKAKIKTKPKPARQLHDIFTEIVLRQPHGLDHILKPVAVVLNRRALLETTDGTSIAEVLEWVGTPGLAPVMRQDHGFDFKAVQQVPSFTVALLKLYAQALEPVLLGVLPDQYFAYIQLRCEAASAPHRETLALGSEDHKDLQRALCVVGPLLEKNGGPYERD